MSCDSIVHRRRQSRIHKSQVGSAVVELELDHIKNVLGSGVPKLGDRFFRERFVGSKQPKANAPRGIVCIPPHTFRFIGILVLPILAIFRLHSSCASQKRNVVLPRSTPDHTGKLSRSELDCFGCIDGGFFGKSSVGIFFVLVDRPFTDAAVHVVQAKPIWLFRAHFGRARI